MRTTLLTLVLAVPILVGCSGDPGSDESAEPTTEVSIVPEDVQCATDAVATFPGSGAVPLQDGKAVGLGGPAYTIFAGDYEIPADGLRINGAQAGPGQHLAFVATTVYNGAQDLPSLEIGEPIEWTQDFGVLTFAVVLDDEGEVAGANEDATGTVTVTGLDDTTICVDVDYRDAEKSVVGTIAAQIV